jgi:hypothetical protein
MYGERKGIKRVLVGKPEVNGQFRRLKNIWEDNIKTFSRNGIGDMEWIDLVQDRDKWQALVRAAVNLHIP